MPKKTVASAAKAMSGKALGKKSAQKPARKSADKVSVILAAGLGLFSRFGLHGTTVDQIAARADVSKSNLLYHFPTKEALYVAVLRSLLQVWLEPLKAFEVNDEPEQVLRRYIRAKLELSRDQPDASRLFCLEMVQGAPLLKDDLATQLRQMVLLKSDVINKWIASGKLAPVEPHHLIFALWAITQHYADFAVQVQAVAGKSLDDSRFFEQTVANVQDMVLSGVLPKRRYWRF